MRWSITLFVALAVFSTPALAEPEPIPQTEESDIIKLPPWSAHRILVQDTVARHAKDGRVYVLDADQGKILGMVQESYNGNVVLDPKGRSFYVSETTWSRGNRGERNDLLASYDPQTFQIENDFKLPGRALVTPKKNNLAINADGSLVYVFDMVPTNAVHVIETKTHSLLKNIDLPGCALVYPWGNSGFSSICGDGGLSNVLIDHDHIEVTHTKPFFDPEKDAVFEHSPSDKNTGQTFFITYSGLVYPSTLSAQTTVEKPWSIQEAAGLPRASDAGKPFEIAWRPGGWQLSALHYATHRMYVVMHKNTFWTHKEDGTEIWVLNTETHKLLHRFTLPEPTSMVGLTQDAHPLMFTDDAHGGFYIFDAENGKLLHKISHLGDDLYFTVALGE
ncbi:methylamine dehydrogenase heavy chain [Neokomagataea thailandica NBRC 106555]|uniref:Amine dehydrogenase n=2 Tax=Neokomagataea TaxID=1223423 RepID=A0A4Y6V628_9PROT|nr:MULTISPECIES: amine dehydrogenase large subunit [Neokomagataea]QDH25509.1 amine dehydrogenase [Neokomagataea tanensis]GBR55061.1 methylamine dehydrogenase heavy chain [Neokomagataea thailandica NBRC 106555]